MTDHRPLAPTIGAVTLIVGLCLAPALAAAQDADAHAGHDMSAMSSADVASQAYMDAMSTMSQSMEDMTMTGKPGVDFATMMIPHHQSAVDMAKAYLESGEDDPELTALAEAVIQSQEAEIGVLKAWLDRNRAP